jgi:hypothetical protein
MGRTLLSKGKKGSHEHGAGILAHCNGGRSCSVGCGTSLRSNFYSYAAQEQRQKSLVIAKERPRHAERETGLVITSDFCPAGPGSYTRRSASLEISIFVCLRLGQSVISSLERNGQTVPLALRQGLKLTLGWRHSSSARVDRRDDRDVGEEREVPRFGHPKTTQLTTAASVTNELNTLPEYVGSAGKYSCLGRSGFG